MADQAVTNLAMRLARPQLSQRGSTSAPRATSRSTRQSSRPRTATPRQATAREGVGGAVVNLENLDDVSPPIPTVLNSPRSVRACMEEGIDPVELLPYVETITQGVSAAIRMLRRQHYELRRQEKLKVLRNRREAIIRAEHAVHDAPQENEGGLTAGVGESMVDSTVKAMNTVEPSRAMAALFRQREVQRQRAYDRARDKKLERERLSLEKCRQEAQIVVERQRRMAEERAVNQEQHRLRMTTALERVEHARRRDEYRTALKKEELRFTSRVVDKYSLVWAKEQYRSPSTRSELRRSSSSLR